MPQKAKFCQHFKDGDMLQSEVTIQCTSTFNPTHRCKGPALVVEKVWLSQEIVQETLFEQEKVS